MFPTAAGSLSKTAQETAATAAHQSHQGLDLFRAIATLTAHNSPQQPSTQYVASLDQHPVHAAAQRGAQHHSLSTSLLQGVTRQAPQHKENSADQTSQVSIRSIDSTQMTNVQYDGSVVFMQTTYPRNRILQ
ncbi:hypothetical protein KIN20_019124 [Parelaphostrongylus tenuis]|uniref:Uncharacterized protein n=1 Tax=Parelaphostrongylus tenuis TaxID=148309 RepID=A0AAD5MNZ5_PARTN|nr:hypothetical protein KIN20_019124 [Parelaphostrongylus tenuis]